MLLRELQTQAVARVVQPMVLIQHQKQVALAL
jgi:hypothetical protein